MHQSAQPPSRGGAAGRGRGGGQKFKPNVSAQRAAPVAGIGAGPEDEAASLEEIINKNRDRFRGKGGAGKGKGKSGMSFGRGSGTASGFRPNISAGARTKVPKSDVHQATKSTGPRGARAEGQQESASEGQQKYASTSVKKELKIEEEEEQVLQEEEWDEPEPMVVEEEYDDDQGHPPIRLPLNESQKIYQNTKILEEPEVSLPSQQDNKGPKPQGPLNPGDGLVFVQLPSILPKTGDWVGPNKDSIEVDENKPIEAGMKDKISGEPDYSSNLQAIAPGHIGRLRRHKSGKMSLQLGNVIYKVNRGVECSFSQQVLAMDLEQQSCHFVGSIKDSLICSLDVNSLFRN